jgi:hypothetical protein
VGRAAFFRSIAGNQPGTQQNRSALPKLASQVLASAVGGCISIALCHFFSSNTHIAAMSPPVSLTKSAFFRFLTGKIA